MRDQSLELLQSFVPRWVVRRLAQRGAPPKMPSHTAGRGAALFADISGFTALTERLARQGPDGAERLTELLDRAFGGMIEACAGTGGDVLSFAGDALLVVWSGDDAVERALDAAARCHRALEAASSAGESLRLRVGIGGGELSLHELGANNRWLAVGGGAALHGMAVAERTAQPGETVLRLAAGHPIPPGLEGADRPEGLRVSVRPGDFPPPPAEPEVEWSISAEVGLRCFLPAAVLSRVDAGQTAWMAELRTISPLFVLLRGLDPSRHADAPVVQRVLEATLDALDVFEGTLDKVLVDDRGTSLVVAFGYPPPGARRRRGPGRSHRPAGGGGLSGGRGRLRHRGRNRTRLLRSLRLAGPARVHDAGRLGEPRGAAHGGGRGRGLVRHRDGEQGARPSAVRRAPAGARQGEGGRDRHPPADG